MQIKRVNPFDKIPPATCDKNQVSQEFSELISTVLYGISQVSGQIPSLQYIV